MKVYREGFIEKENKYVERHIISRSRIINRRNKMKKNHNDAQNFVTREEFMERTGIFITPDYFHNVCNEWQDEASKAGITMDDFIDNYEENHIGLVEDISLTGTFIGDC